MPDVTTSQVFPLIIIIINDLFFPLHTIVTFSFLANLPIVIVNLISRFIRKKWYPGTHGCPNLSSEYLEECSLCLSNRLTYIFLAIKHIAWNCIAVAII